MNTYTHTVPICPMDQIRALDEATGQKIPDDMLLYIILPMLGQQTSSETVTTVKMQPRNAFKELKSWCRIHHGGCGLCTFNTATCLCMTPNVLLNMLARGFCLVGGTLAIFPCMLGGLAAEHCCEIKCCDVENSSVLNAFDHLMNTCIGDRMPCAGDDYRLRRSCCADTAQLANQCCCCADESPKSYLPPPRNGPAAMWME
jgi:hypothetical protein